MKIKRYCIWLSVMLLIASVAHSQAGWEKRRDSLELLISKGKEDSVKADRLLKLGRLFDRRNTDSALYYFNVGEKISRSVHYINGQVDALAFKTNSYMFKGEMDSALVYGKSCLALAMRIGSKRNIAVANEYMGAYSIKKGDNKQAAEYYLAAEKLDDELQLLKPLGENYCDLCYCFNNLKDYSHGYYYGKKAIEICRKSNSPVIEAIALVNTGGSLIFLQKFDSALIVLNEAAKLAEEQGDFGNLGMALSNCQYIYQRLGKYEMIKPYVDKEYSLAVKNNNHEGMILALLGYGDYYFYQKDFLNARKYFLMSVDSIAKYKFDVYLQNNYLALSDVAIGLGNFKDFEKYGNLRDSIEAAQHSDEILKTAKSLEAKYSSEKKEAQIKKLDQDKQIQQLQLQRNQVQIISLIIIIAVLGLAGFLYFRNTQQKRNLQLQRISELEKEKQLMAATAVLQGQEEERSRLAKDLHDGLGGILSGIKYSFNDMKNNFIVTPQSVESFDRTMVLLDRSISELRNISHNMMPEALLRFGLDAAMQDYCNSISKSNLLQVTYQSFDLDEQSMDKTKASVVYRVLQELLNNTMKHAAATTALVQIVRKGNALSISVEDNGKGFDTTEAEKSEGIGMKNIRNRIEYLKGTLDIDAGPGKGAAFNIEVPNIAA